MARRGKKRRRQLREELDTLAAEHANIVQRQVSLQEAFRGLEEERVPKAQRIEEITKELIDAD